MSPSFSIHFKNGIPPQEERNRIRMDIERQMSGASNAGKFIVTYSDDPERKPDFEPFQLSDAHNQYQFLSEEVTAKIMVGHRVTNPQMFGVAVPGKAWRRWRACRICGAIRAKRCETKPTDSRGDRSNTFTGCGLGFRRS